MRILKVLIPAACAVALAAALLVPSQRATGFATPVATPQPHPLVGSWRSVGGGSLYTFFADGTAMATDEQGFTYHGAWRAVGPDDVTFVLETIFEGGGGQGLEGRLRIGNDPDEIAGPSARLQRILAPDLSDIGLPATPAP